MESEHKSAEVTFKYYIPENQEDIFLHINASKMYELIYEIDQKCRSVIKYEDDPTEEKFRFAEEIRDMIHNNIDMDMVS